MAANMQASCHATQFEAGQVSCDTAIFDNLSVAVMMTDQEWQITYANRRYLEFTGFQRAELLGRHSGLVSPGSDQAESCSEFQCTTRAGRTWRGELVDRCADGSNVRVNVVISPVSGALGDVRGYLCVHESEPIHRHAQGAIDVAKHLIEMGPVPLLLIGQNGLILAANSKAADFYGTSHEMLRGRCYFDLASNPSMLQRHFENETSMVPQHGHRARSGTVRRVELRITRLAGPLAGINLIALKDLEEEIRLREQMFLNEERWRFALEGGGDGIWDWHIDTGQIQLSAQGAGMLGYPHKERICSYAEWTKLLHPDDAERVLETLREAIADPDTVYSDESRMRGNDDRWKWIALRGKVVLRNSKGEPTRMLGTLRDVDDWTLLTLKLWASENKWSQLFHLSPTAITVAAFDSGNTIIEANQAFLRLTGYTREEIIGISGSSLNLWLDEAERQKYVREAMLGRKIVDRQVAVRRKDGHLIPVALSLQAIDLGTTRVLLAIRRDLTDAERAYEALRVSEARWQFAIEGAGDALWDWDVVANSVFRSPRWFEMLQLGSDARRSTIEQFVSHLHAEDRPSALEQLVDLKEGRIDSFRRDYRLQVREDTCLWISMTGKTMSRDAHHKGTRVIGTIRDISRRKRAEEAARKQQEQLAHSARLIQLGEMASAMAHEINQPLTAIANFSGVCKRVLDDHAEAQRCLEKIEQQALRAGEIIWRMRDFARKRAKTRNPVCLSELVTQVFNWVTNEARLYDVNLLMCVPEIGLPKVHVDRVQIEQVLLNLVANGIDAMRDVPNERIIEVSICRIAGEQEILVSVHDSGSGIPENIARDIFKPFFTTKDSGLGLGLAVSVSIIEDHGGRIWLSSSKASNGTTFFFTLPAIQDESDV